MNHFFSILVQRLVLNNNKLAVLPTDVAGLTVLKRLAISNNQLSMLPLGAKNPNMNSLHMYILFFSALHCIAAQLIGLLGPFAC